MNNLKLSGFLGNVELSYTPTGTPVTKGYIKFTTGKDDKGEYVHDFFSFTAWKEVAEKLNDAFIADDTALYELEGMLNAQRWTAKDGNERKSYSLTAFSFKSLRGDAPANPSVASGKQGTRKPFSNSGSAGRTTAGKATPPTFNK